MFVTYLSCNLSSSLISIFNFVNRYVCMKACFSSYAFLCNNNHLEIAYVLRKRHLIDVIVGRCAWVSILQVAGRFQSGIKIRL